MTSPYELTYPASGPAALPAPAAEATVPQPWGFWGTLGWLFLAATAGLLASLGVVIVWLIVKSALPNVSDGGFAVIALVATILATLKMFDLAIKARGWRARDYLALTTPRLRDILLGISCLALLTVAFMVMVRMFDLDNGSESMEKTYEAARAAGLLPLLWIAVVIIAPVTEELVFRGFLYRGWAASRLGAAGTVVLTALIWALLHRQYPWLGIAFVFCTGLTLGWLRERSGSTTTTIVLHALYNLCVTILITAELGI
jgi:membrane protease YdiL (CAAX protease family)